MAAMRIVDVSTTGLHAPHLPGIQDATIRHRTPGRARAVLPPCVRSSARVSLFLDGALGTG